MTNAFSLFRSLIIYGICLPLAIFIGYLLATPMDISSYVSVGLLLALMTVPLLMRWHYPLLVLSWNTTAGFYFLPGKPSFSLFMICVSFFFSLLAYILNRNVKFIPVPTVAKPLIFIAAVVLVTAKLTGSLGLNVLGSESLGGKRYIYLLSGVIAFFAITAQKIPERKADLYIKMFFLAGITSVIGNLANIISPGLSFIFLIFPPDDTVTSTVSFVDNSAQITRLSGLSSAAVAGLTFLLARYGVRGLLDMRKLWRPMLFLALVVTDLFGGFRSRVIDLLLLLSILFYLEGLMRSRLLPAIILIALLFAAFVLPFSDKLPLSIQRSLTFLPLNLDQEAVLSAQASTDWRLEMWASVLPLVPQYLILGKGLGIDAHDFAMMTSGLNKGEISASGSLLSGDYHNGPLSVIVPFGIFGMVGLIWFLVAGFRVLQRNYHYGDPAYETINRFLYAFFIVKIIVFFLIFGSFYSDLVFFVGPIGLSVALNGGVRNPELEPVARPALNRFKLANATR